MKSRGGIMTQNLFLFVLYSSLVTLVIPANQRFNSQRTLIASGSAQVPKVGYVYPVPAEGAASTTRAQLKFPPLALPRPSSNVERLPSASAQEPSIQQPRLEVAAAKAPEVDVEVPKEDETPTTTAEIDLNGGTTMVPGTHDETMTHHHHHDHPQIEAIDVACGKEIMTIRVTFDSAFNGIIYAKGHYSDPKCRFVSENSGEMMYQFELTTGECGVSFIDDGLMEGGQAYVEALLVIIFEPGVQEAWDASRKIRCLWEGNLEQTVTFPLSVNMLEQKLLTFSGDTATVGLEIQAGDGPRATPVQGLVRIGDMLTVVVTVQGDAAFDILVRNCVATDGTETNRILLSDTRGCATKPKLMGGWTKERGTGGMLSFARLSAFKFPDVMDLFLECTVSLCKGACEECPAAEFVELHIPPHDEESFEDEGNEIPTTTLVPDLKPTPNITENIALPSMRVDIKVSNRRQAKRRPRRSPQIQSNHVNLTGMRNPPGESLQLRRVVHVVGPDDFPEFSFGSFASAFPAPSATIYGTPNGSNRCLSASGECISLLGVVSAVAVMALLLLLSVAIFGALRRRSYEQKCFT